MLSDSMFFFFFFTINYVCILTSQYNLFKILSTAATRLFLFKHVMCVCVCTQTEWEHSRSLGSVHALHTGRHSLH